MKTTTPLLLLAICSQAPIASALLLLPNFFRNSLAKPASHKHQTPIMNIPNILAPDSKDKEPSAGSDSLSISDVIGKDRVINIFAGFTRDIDTISKRLDDQTQNTTVLAPLNSALQKLPRKPWEDPEDYNAMGEKAYEGQSGEDRAHGNLRRFAEAHVVPVSPWKEGEKVETMGGGTVWWESRDGGKVVCTGDLLIWGNDDGCDADLVKVQPGNIEVSSVAERVSNGEVWILKGCLNYA